MMRVLILLLSVLLLGGSVYADEPQWQQIAYKTSAKKMTRKALARRQYDLFKFFLDESLHGKGKEDFLNVSGEVENNIAWRNSSGGNAYNEAFRKSYKFIKSYDLQGMPDIVMLIPCMESLWNGKKGKPSADYGYWQLVRPIVEEIQQLDYAPLTIKQSTPDQIRADAALSTRTAQIHLHRYYFYFAKVAGFKETDAWLLTMLSFNWGAGNVKRLIADLQARGGKADFSSVYHHLYAAYQNSPGDKSMKAAVEYLPSLWNIAQLINKSN